MEVLVLRLDAPLMSFGSVRVDQMNGTDRFPYRSMLTGLIANALGLTRDDPSAHEALQRRLRYAARADRLGEVLEDYQTVDFDPDGSMANGLGWTTSGQLEMRKGGEASEGTHIRLRQYLADAIFTVAVSLDDASSKPTIADVSDALRAPARPIFLGRKCCVPSSPLWLGTTQAKSLREALESWPRIQRGRSLEQGMLPLPAIWQHAGDDFEERDGRLWPRVEDRDWENSIHVGRRIYVEGTVNPPYLGEEEGGEAQ